MGCHCFIKEDCGDTRLREMMLDCKRAKRQLAGDLLPCKKRYQNCVCVCVSLCRPWFIVQSTVCVALRGGGSTERERETEITNKPYVTLNNVYYCPRLVGFVPKQNVHSRLMCVGYVRTTRAYACVLFTTH